MSSRTEHAVVAGDAVRMVSGLAHTEALDGIRGLAILGVILVHYTWFTAGWVGVQVFFVLSGYLITSILLADLDLVLPYYLKRFYWRRTLRIFPLYFGYLAVLTVSYLLSGMPEAIADQWPFLYSYTFNFYDLTRGGTYSRLLGHLWSLSVEEQFYLVWPLLVYLLRGRKFQVVVVSLIVLGPILRAITAATLRALGHDPILLGDLMFSQLDAFAFGAGVALFRTRLATHALPLFVTLSVMVLTSGQANELAVTGKLALDTSLGFSAGMIAGGQYLWAYTLLNAWTGTLILLSLQPGPVARLLGFSPLVRLGKISYGVYVYHNAVLVGTRLLLGDQHGLLNLLKFLFYIVVLVAASAASYRWFEAPFLRQKDRFFSVRPVGTPPREA